MKNEKLKWYIVDNKYVNYLRKYDNKVERIDYNKRIKPYIGIVLNIKEYNYYIPISSVKEKHYKIAEDMDFIKLIQNNKILGVLNINNMIPILNENIKELVYNDLEKYIQFNCEKEKKQYIALLSLELKLINNKMNKIRKSAYKIYYEKIKNPDSRISKRCCNFKLLEEKCKLYESKNN